MQGKMRITTDNAPKALGPYSVGQQAGNFVYTAGQLGIDPNTGQLVSGGIQPETRQALINLRNILSAAGAEMADVVKTTVFLRDMQEFSLMNEVYAEFFSADFPARSAVQVAALPLGAAVEIEAVAYLSES